MFDAKTMTNSERGKKAAEERWNPTIPRSTHTGILKIAGKEIACDVLEGGKRVLRQKTLLNAMGKGKAAGEDVKRALSQKIPIFVCANNLSAYLEQDFLSRAQEIFYRTTDGRKVIGYDASILPEACKIYVKAEADGVLQKVQMQIASVCKIMLYGLATVGIISLVDDATNYTEIRNRSELEKILEIYICEEFRKWNEKFPNEFFKQIYRLHGWQWPKINKNHPQYVGKIINKNIYERLPEGVLEELKIRNPTNENGIRNYRHHQFLTPKTGEDHLNKQILQVISIMKVSENIEEFNKLMERI